MFIHYLASPCQATGSPPHTPLIGLTKTSLLWRTTLRTAEALFMAVLQSSPPMGCIGLGQKKWKVQSRVGREFLLQVFYPRRSLLSDHSTGTSTSPPQQGKANAPHTGKQRGRESNVAMYQSCIPLLYCYPLSRGGAAQGGGGWVLDASIKPHPNAHPHVVQPQFVDPNSP